MLHVDYTKYTCSKCGASHARSYTEPYKTQMVEHKMCFTCNFWRDFAENRTPAELTIIDGIIYSPEDGEPHQYNGMGGRRFDICYLEGSVFDGQMITTYNLWCGGKLPEELREKFPDNACFLNGAQRVDNAWDSSNTRAPPYKRPSMRVRNPK